MDHCSSCRYFGEGRGQMGTCRRHAPVLVPANTQHLAPEYPVVPTTHWCGDYERKIEKAAIPPINATWDYV